MIEGSMESHYPLLMNGADSDFSPGSSNFGAAGGGDYDALMEESRDWQYVGGQEGSGGQKSYWFNKKTARSQCAKLSCWWIVDTGLDSNSKHEQ